MGPKVRRSAVLKHFSDEAEKLEDFPLHILSDIDQTVVIGTFGAGAFCFFFAGEKLGGFSISEVLLDGQQFMCVTVEKDIKTHTANHEETLGTRGNMYLLGVSPTHDASEIIICSFL